ncbi:TPA: coenzyme F420-0:L-glutamate ligase [Candidatus Bathyarchaeota archaeon]|nr:coenzyme F420-0:L-glutamate ligase [Candidatus Bathyarchaeota archaeon]
MKIIGLEGMKLVKEGDDLATLIVSAAKRQGVKIEDGDVIVVSHKVVSKSEGALARLKEVKPSQFALKLARLVDKDPRIIEVILRDSKRIVRMIKGHLICETIHGFVCANAGVDRSNVGEDTVVSLPKDPDRSARAIREKIRRLVGADVAVVVSDTFGRPWRTGQVNVAVGIAGLKPVLDYRGKKDIFNASLKVTVICVADELASAAELVMGKTNAIPVAIIKGYAYPRGEGSLKELVKPNKYNLFP